MGSLPNGLSPKTREILDRTGEARAGLLSSVEGLPLEQMDFRPNPDSWSIGEILQHLALAHEASAKLMSVLLRRAKEENVSRDPTPDVSVVGSIDGVVPGVEEGRASAPDRVMPREYVAPADSIARLAASRERLVDTVEALSAFDLTELSFPHPFFGELDGYQWLLVTGWHERRHTQQIVRIQASPGFPGR